MMFLEILILIAGLVLIVGGADYLVDGASGIARKAGLSEFVIGLTIVGMGTSAPEMVVSFIGAFSGNADIAVGNVVGSNIMNTLLILGLTALLLPIPITEGNRRKDIPLNIGVTLVLILLGLSASDGRISSGILSRADGGLLLLLFVVYMAYAFSEGRRTGALEASEASSSEPVPPIWKLLLLTVGGLAALIIGGRLFVDSATEIARMAGISDKFIAVTILAGGTSMPELATCIVAAAKKKGQLALGNILGSNIFNILLILGGSALIHPLSLAGMTAVDLGVLLLSSIVVWTSTATFRRREIDRWEGLVFLAIEAAYLAWLLYKL